MFNPDDPWRVVAHEGNVMALFSAPFAAWDSRCPGLVVVGDTAQELVANLESEAPWMLSDDPRNTVLGAGWA